MNKVRKIGENIFEEMNPLFRKEGYLLWKIRNNWKNLAEDIISEKSEVTGLYNGELTINVTDSLMHHTIIMCENILIKKINGFLGRSAVEKIKVRKVKYKKNIVLEIIEEKKKEELLTFEAAVKMDERAFENIELSLEEEEEIKGIVSKIDQKYGDISEKLYEIIKNSELRNKSLLSRGFVKCPSCESIFYPGKSMEMCFNCYEKNENEKRKRMVNLIRENPYIGEGRAVALTGTDSYTYYKVRDTLAQQAYSDLLSFFLEKKGEISDYEEYSYEIRNEIKVDFEVYIKNYIDFKIGTDNREIFMKERGRVIRKLKQEEKFRKGKQSW